MAFLLLGEVEAHLRMLAMRLHMEAAPHLDEEELEVEAHRDKLQQ
jgi:hypothetical protein